ncbi:hypothetical protein [Halalkalicoccus jeotgali]|uniref:Uncharacterized protein n=1 Tax=Halalkalicoccus jeotgali (strain DSM 18796 / CECT 7217 / JCM 14584 / KCTC 4019 / B3) TaxID=795797 RepID=D8J4Q2_HALJB|nr:hypothetical protein [Halalkalicoccus jeotgali]ADJ15519.1 hypothetical protein HacjB3_10680 [Halalkalicoccus jeotgali B3]ELY36072.1 hypothetical protein C497_11987 [Halalkalicoccus jeotgali B3]
MSTRDDDLLVGDSDGIGVRSTESEDEPFDYYLVGPDRGEFGFDAAEVQEIRELLDNTLGNG